MKKCFLILICTVLTVKGFCWGFYAHRLINYRAVFLLPAELIAFYKPNIAFIADHAVDPDKRRYAVADEGPRHYIDMDKYRGSVLPQEWDEAVERYSEDSLKAHGIVPWWIQVMLARLTKAFRERNASAILKLSAETAHYIGDAHVPLHTTSNHNGQYTGQHGIHGFWESRIPEIYAESQWDLLEQKATYIKNPLEFVWRRIAESAAASDSVLQLEKQLNAKFSPGRKYAYENRNGLMLKQYSTDYCDAYQHKLNGMVERRMKESVFTVASLWYTAWVNAGQPEVKNLINKALTEEDQRTFDELETHWRKEKIKGRSCS